MAITKLISNPCNSDDALRNLCNYIVNPEKVGNSGRYVFGRGIRSDTAYEDITEMQELFGKDSGRRAYHLMVSLPDNCGLGSEDMLEISRKISDLFYPRYQILCGVHVCQEHLHAHFAVNPVPMEAGNNRKLEINYSFMTELSQEIEKIIDAYT